MRSADLKMEKISFTFKKTTKSNIFKKPPSPKPNRSVELIKAVEGQAIQLVQEKIEEKPFVIPLQNDQRTSSALQSLNVRKAALNGTEEDSSQTTQNKGDSKTHKQIAAGPVDVEKQAVLELIAEAQNEAITTETSTLTLPLSADSLPLEGAAESNLSDYESVPISQFGLGMLRGMGWKDPPKGQKTAILKEEPIVRPKGMGLGVDRALKSSKLLIPPQPDEVLEVKVGARIRVVAGKHKDLYGTVTGLDDHAGRVFVKMTLTGVVESFNEFLVQPVSKKEYSVHSKCINSAKYEKYKEMEMETRTVKGDSKSVKDGSKSEKGDRKSVKEGSKSVKDDSKSVKEGSKSVKDDSKFVKGDSKFVKDDSKSVKDNSKSVKDDSKSGRDRSKNITTEVNVNNKKMSNDERQYEQKSSHKSREEKYSQKHRRSRSRSRHRNTNNSSSRDSNHSKKKRTTSTSDSSASDTRDYVSNRHKKASKSHKEKKSKKQKDEHSRSLSLKKKRSHKRHKSERSRSRDR